MLKQSIADLLLEKYGKKNPAQIKAGDTVKVHQKIKEGEKERIQIFEGLVIAVKHGKSLDAAFTVRKISNGVGVERNYPLHSPNIVKIERTKSAKVARAKLYYMRGRAGKNARFKSESANHATWSEPAAPAVVEVSEESAE
jgi:large subunit ribosomal protein L19